MRIACIMVLAAVSSAQTADSNSEILSVAVAQPDSEEAVNRLIAAFNTTSDTRIYVAMKEIFSRSQAKRVRQKLAMTLLQSGERDELYITELLTHARGAIASTAPLPFGDDVEVNTWLGHFA